MQNKSFFSTTGWFALRDVLLQNLMVSSSLWQLPFHKILSNELGTHGEGERRLGEWPLDKVVNSRRKGKDCFYRKRIQEAFTSIKSQPHLTNDDTIPGDVFFCNHHHHHHLEIVPVISFSSAKSIHWSYVMSNCYCPALKQKLSSFWSLSLKGSFKERRN